MHHDHVELHREVPSAGRNSTSDNLIGPRKDNPKKSLPGPYEQPRVQVYENEKYKVASHMTNNGLLEEEPRLDF